MLESLVLEGHTAAAAIPAGRPAGRPAAALAGEAAAAIAEEAAAAQARVAAALDSAPTAKNLHFDQAGTVPD